MRRLLFLALLLVCLNSCGHGPLLVVCASDPANDQFDCSTRATLFHKATTSTLTYPESVGYYVYPPASAQSLLDYCAARHDVTTQAPDIAACISTGSLLDCINYHCAIIPQGGGISCSPIHGTDSAVLFSASENYVAFSPADDRTLMDYCNIEIRGN